MPDWAVVCFCWWREAAAKKGLERGGEEGKREMLTSSILIISASRAVWINGINTGGGVGNF